MSTKNKFRKERYIKQKEYKGAWYFEVRVKGQTKSFNSNDFLSPRQAFDKAIEYRNQLVVGIVPLETKSSVEDLYLALNEIYVLRSETQRKLDVFYRKYIHHKDKQISKVTRADILSDLNLMVEDCSNDTITRVFSIWRKIFGVGIAKGIISKDITQQITPPKSHKIKGEKRNELTSEQSYLSWVNGSLRA